MAEFETDFESTLERMERRVDGNIGKGEGTLLNFALAPAAAELCELYNDIEANDLNGSPLTCDREHLIKFGESNNIPIKTATNAVWLACFNVDFEVGERFEAGDLTYVSTEKIDDGKYYLTCEQSGSAGNEKPDEELLPIEFIEDYETGELVELIAEAADDEETEVYRERYLSERKQENNTSGNRESYKKEIKALDGVGGVKLERVKDGKRRIDAYIVSGTWKKPSDDVVNHVQQVMDPKDSQGDGNGRALFFHVMDIHPVEERKIDIRAQFELQSSVTFEEILEELKSAVDKYLTELIKTWEDEKNLIVRMLKLSEVMSGVEGVIDIVDLSINGAKDNFVVDTNAIPIRGDIENVS